MARKRSAGSGSAGRRPARKDLEARLRALQATGLFLDLDEARVAELRHRGGTTDDDLGNLIENHLSAGGCRDFAARSPQSAEPLQVIGLGHLIADDPMFAAKCVHILTGRRPIYRPRTHQQWAAVLNEALRSGGDPRSFVPLRTIDLKEQLFVLATPEQARALEEVDLADMWAEMRLPAKISAKKRAEQLVRQITASLPRGCGSVAWKDDAVTISFGPGGALALIDALRLAKHADQRHTMYVQRAYL
jgi:hypothetical protein